MKWIKNKSKVGHVKVYKTFVWWPVSVETQSYYKLYWLETVIMTEAWNGYKWVLEDIKEI